MNLKHLFSPVWFGNLELENRIKFPGLATGFVKDGEVTDQLKAFYAERAKSRPGIIGVCVSPCRLDGGPWPSAHDDAFIPGLMELVSVFHDNGCRVQALLMAGYAFSFPGHQVEFVSPSGISVSGRVEPPYRLGGPRPGASSARRALDEEDLAALFEAYGAAARRAREAGFDAVEVNIGGSYVLGQFLSPLTNQRTDKYGGSVEKRMTVAREVIAAIRKQAGDEWPCGVRVSGQFTGNGISVGDLQKICAILEQDGVQAIDIAPGWHEDRVAMVQSRVPQGQWSYLSAEIKKVVSVIVGAGTRIQDPEVADQVIADGKADYVYMARACIADPDMPEKARSGRLAAIRPCISCCCCYTSVIEESGLSCTVNPAVGEERVREASPAVSPRQVIVVGGGPAGIEAALGAAQKGHRVTLFEKEPQLGGKLGVAALPLHKPDIDRLREHLVHQVENSPVDVRLSSEATARDIVREKPDVCIVATGASAIVPNLPGIRQGNVFFAEDVLRGQCEPGKRVVIVGGGQVGCETAEFLVVRGKQVTLVEMLPRIGSDIVATDRWLVLQELKQIGVSMLADTKAVEITSDGLNVEHDGKTVLLEADSIVIAVGMKAPDSLATELDGSIPVVRVVGDAVTPRRVAEAIRSGYRAGLEV